MEAIVYTEYGSPDVLQLKDVEKPTPENDQVLVNIHTASVNPLDWHRMRGAPFMVRFSEGLGKPKNPFLGADIAGKVEAVGKNIKQFQAGDEVFGSIGAGGLAEYACMPEKAIVRKPANISFAEAAAVPVAALTALQALRDHGQIHAGQQVLINGASGGVGTYAVQLAKHFGAEITAVCSTRNIDMVRSLGAAHAIDYTTESPIQTSQHYDLIVDNVGNLSVANYKQALKPHGTAVVVGFTTMRRMLQVIILGGISSKFGSKKIGSMLAKVTQKDLLFLKELLEGGQLVSVIDRCYPLSETADAMRYLEAGHARGKVIISLEV